VCQVEETAVVVPGARRVMSAPTTRDLATALGIDLWCLTDDSRCDLLVVGAMLQAVKFGTRLVSPRSVTGLAQVSGGFRVRLDAEDDIMACAVIIASGARYRRLDVPGLADLEGRGVYYAASDLEATPTSPAPRRPDRCAEVPPWRKYRPTTIGGWPPCQTYDASITSASPSRTSTP
jgi:hypothetical protein